MMNALIRNVWARAAVVAAFFLVAIIVALPADWRQGAGLRAAYMLGVIAPALVIGAGVGWIAYSKLVWFWSTIALAGATVGLYFAFGATY